MFVTIYSRTIKRRKTGRIETVGSVYETKSLTPMHAYIRQQYPGAETWENPRRVVTHFTVGMPLERPIVSGGTKVAP